MPEMANGDVSLREQRSEARYVAHIGKDVGLDRRLYLSEDERRDFSSEFPEEDGFLCCDSTMLASCVVTRLPPHGAKRHF
jgi:hypothetical protein